MSSLANLKGAKSTHEFAVLIGYTAKTLTALIYAPTRDLSYQVFTVPKKNGGVRKISAPNRKLKKLQKRLATLLSDCWDEINTQKKNNNLSPVSHGFERGRTTISNASYHVKRRYVFNTDIENFFPSINFGRIRGFFIKNKNFRLNPKIATIIAQIACHENSLPQGSPCSPILANMIASNLDAQLLKLAKKNNCYYTRYADDLTFSCNEKKFPKEIATKTFFLGSTWKSGEKLNRIVEQSGFRINEKKTRNQLSTSRQEVTGLVTNRRVNIKKEYYKTVRSMCLMLFSCGFFYQKEEIIKKNPVFSLYEKVKNFFFGRTRAPIPQVDVKMARVGTISELEGMLNHIYEVKKSYYKNLIKSKNSKILYPFCPPSKKGSFSGYPLVGAKKLYYNFLVYKFFYAPEKPVIICEGETDYIYLKKCLKLYAAAYPDLIQKKDRASEREAEKFTYSTQFFEYTNRISELFEITGGVDWMTKLIEHYNAVTARFTFKPKNRNPVIFLTDNDEACKKLFETVKKKTNNEVDGTKEFYRIQDNLYLLPIPKKSLADKIQIEDLLSERLLKHTLTDGRTFTTSNTYDNSKHYGKMDFAKRVVKTQANAADFIEFVPLLASIRDIISLQKSSPST